ncbi:hypothetical protein SKAU_G00057700 [Synaphobranchus kaupii]|uniref:WIF domain-containing protein n=1 Tax=Synaphobranchus kaupii TaxID=118154 RepID=A0A9Q1G4E2_SYNKA|nr:hypothetical protein SKAU_G00057700 [Synaphobranchus kaupii]
MIYIRNRKAAAILVLAQPDRLCGSGWSCSVPWRRKGLFFLLLQAAVCLANPSVPGMSSSKRPGVNVFMSAQEVNKFLGQDGELYYVRDDVVSHYALSFIMRVPTDTNSLHFTWLSTNKVQYKLGFQVDNPAAMSLPKSSIPTQGEVPHSRSVFRVDLFCSGKMDAEVILTMQLNLTIHANNITVLNFKRRKVCYRRLEQSDPKVPPFLNKTLNRPIFESVNAAPTTSTRVFYISVGVCCAVIFLVAIVLAVLHLHSMKRVEMDDSESDSGSSQGLSQPSTQTTQYLRADTPNNATPVTNSQPGSAPILHLAAASFPNPGAPSHETKIYPSLRIEKNDLRSVTLLEAKARVKDIAVSRERVTLRDVLQEEGRLVAFSTAFSWTRRTPARRSKCL